MNAEEGEGQTCVQLTRRQREAAARDLASHEGWLPDSISGKGRPIWEAYAEHLDKTISAINAALRNPAP